MSKSRLKLKIFDSIYSSLLGSCECLDDHFVAAIVGHDILGGELKVDAERIERFYDAIEVELLEYLEGNIFRCEGCAWWCGVEEQGESGECEDCGE